MRSFKILLSSALVALSLGAVATPASAQATRTWVSGVGDDVNPCSRTAPCKTFPGAISKTAAGGEINCLDPGGFGGVTITKSITIDCSGTFGSILITGTNAVIVNGAGINVILRGLSINGATPGSPGLNGIRFLQGSSLTVEDSIIFNFRSVSPNGNGILVNNTAATSELLVRNTTILNGEKGIFIAPTTAGAVDVTVESSNLSNNTVGIRVDTSTAPLTTGKINLAINDTVISGNTNSAIVAIGGTGAISASINGVTATNNGQHGIRASGANTRLLLGNSSLVNNVIGTQIDGGATLSSFGTNSINNNGTDGPNPTVIPQK